MSSSASVAAQGSSPLPPGPRNALLTSLHYFRDPFGFHARMKKRFGPLFTLPGMLGGKLVVTGEPEGAREIFSAPPRSFGEAFGTELVLPFVGPGSLLTLFGEAHRRERQRLSPSFHGARMRAYGEPIVATTLSVGERLMQPGAELPSIEVSRRIALEVILRGIFGAEEREEVDELATVLTRATASVHPAIVFFPFLQRDFGGIGPWARFQRVGAAADEVVYARIREARKTADSREDILSKMIVAEYEDGSRASDEHLRDSLLTLTVGGHETTAAAIAWCIYELHRNPDSLTRLRREIDALGRDPTPEALADLPYLEGVVREALRLHPAITDVMRMVADGFEFRGYSMPEGTAVGVSIPLIHGNSQLYPEPERFRPERFLERRFGPHEYVSFGGGHRHCIGSAFAMAETKLVLGTLVSRWDFELVNDRPIRTVRRNIVLAPGGGVPIRVAGLRKTSMAVPRAS